MVGFGAGGVLDVVAAGLELGALFRHSGLDSCQSYLRVWRNSLPVPRASPRIGMLACVGGDMSDDDERGARLMPSQLDFAG